MTGTRLPIAVRQDAVRVGGLRVRFQRTLRLPESRTDLPLPPSFGSFPLKRLPPDPSTDDVVLLMPMHHDEAMWLAFDTVRGASFAVQVGLGTVDAVSGGAFASKLRREPQNYIVLPDQPWLDGINIGSGRVRQFVARRLGRGETVEAQLAGRESLAAIRLCVWPLAPGAKARPKERSTRAAARAPLGLGAGAVVTQKVYPDPYGPGSWDAQRRTCLTVRIVSDDEYRQLTGRLAPPSPISAKTYTDLGYPWFALDDADQDTVAPEERLARVKSVGEIEAGGRPPEKPLTIDPRQIRRIRRRSRGERGPT